jgi:hypothetical protein
MDTTAQEIENAAASELTATEDPQFGSKKLSEMTGPEMLELQHEMVTTAKDLGMDGSDCVPRKVWRNKADGVRTILAFHKRIAAHRAGNGAAAPEPISPGLKRLRASKNAEGIRKAVVADNDAALKTAKKERQLVWGDDAKKEITRRGDAARKDVAKAGRAPSNDIESKTIKMLHNGPNPKRANAAKRFTYYKDGMSVADYIKKVGDRVLAVADVRWDTKKGWIKLV